MKKQRLMALVLAVLFCAALLAGCTNSGGGTSPTPTADTSTEPDETPEGSGEPDETGNSDDLVDEKLTVKVGILGPYTGTVAQYGLNVRSGADLYIKQYNAGNGSLTIEPVHYDEEGDPAKAVTGYNYLMDEGVAAIIGDVTTAPMLAVVSESQADNTVLITASATGAAVTYDEASDTVYENVFRSCFTDPFQGRTMADFAFEELNATTAAVLFHTSDDYSVGLKDAFNARCEELGIEIVASEGFTAGAVDFQGQLTTIASKNPDVLFVPYYYETIALVAQQAASAGLTTTMIGGDGWDTVLEYVSDPALLEGAYYCSGYTTHDPTSATQQFFADYMEEYGTSPDTFCAQGYEAAAILIAAIEKVAATGIEVGSDEYNEALIAAMKATDLESVTGPITYDAFNNPEKEAVIINIAGGELSFWGKF